MIPGNYGVILFNRDSHGLYVNGGYIHAIDLADMDDHIWRFNAPEVATIMERLHREAPNGSLAAVVSFN